MGHGNNGSVNKHEKVNAPRFRQAVVNTLTSPSYWNSEVAQRKRVGLITQRSVDRNHPSLFYHNVFDGPLLLWSLRGPCTTTLHVASLRRNSTNATLTRLRRERGGSNRRFSTTFPTDAFCHRRGCQMTPEGFEPPTSLAIYTHRTCEFARELAQRSAIHGPQYLTKPCPIASYTAPQCRFLLQALSRPSWTLHKGSRKPKHRSK